MTFFLCIPSIRTLIVRNKKICFISGDYPEEGRPVFTFVKNIVDALADNGNDCTVIAPFSITKNKRLHKIRETYKTSNGALVKVYRPNIITLSNYKIMGVRPTSLLFNKAVCSALRKLEQKPDVIYGHFWKNALSAYRYAQRNNIPLFVATGESVINLNNEKGNLDGFANFVSGVICVSTKNKEESIAKGLTISDKCVVIPNAINPTIFRKMDKQECRRKLGFDSEIFVTITVGTFIHRKGTVRVSSAIDKISDDVYSIFIGNGPDVPNCKNILFCGRIDNKDLPLYLNAADVFVLPTLHEGCCNAIIEAMACGLPVISSDLSFNWDILDNTNYILIDPKDVDGIALAIKQLKDNTQLRDSLSKGALETALRHTLCNRAKKIENFISDNM